MADEDQEPTKRMKPETLSWTAIAFSLLAGTGGLTANINSNAKVSEKLDAIVIQVTRLEAVNTAQQATASDLVALVARVQALEVARATSEERARRQDDDIRELRARTGARDSTTGPR